MKRIVILTLCSLLLVCAAACAALEEERPLEETKSLKIVATIFPLYDWTRAVLGERANDMELSMLLDNGVDLHSFQPSVSDLVEIASCDLFLYVGGESDRWVTDALQQSANPNRIVLNLMELLGDRVKEEETVEGMEAEEEEDEEGDAPEYDEHVWLSLKNASFFTEAIEQALAALDPAQKELYRQNAAAYCDLLLALDRSYAETVNAAPVHTLLFADRFPFRYLADDYSLSYYAAFSGCSAETEASFETIVFLAGKADALALPAILQLESASGAIARTVKETAASDPAILTLDSLQSVTARNVQDGQTYLGTMQSNLTVLSEALGASAR